MKRIVLWFLTTASAVVLLFAYHTSTSAQPAAVPQVSGGTAPSESASSSTTVTGEVASTQWGPVQVQLTLQSGKITGVTVLQYPNGNHRDAEINDYALPILIDETTKAQSAQIDMVSGATVTSDGYIRSLQSALDQAK
jgi:uncharacterized protein with FMN-binding domain